MQHALLERARLVVDDLFVVDAPVRVVRVGHRRRVAFELADVMLDFAALGTICQTFTIWWSDVGAYSP